MNKNLFVNIENFNYSACLKYYYKSVEGKYFSTNNPKFTWPHLEHGLTQKNIIYLNTIVIKCDNNSLSSKVLGLCNSEEKINEYINDHQGIYFYFKDILPRIKGTKGIRLLETPQFMRKFCNILRLNNEYFIEIDNDNENVFI